MTRLVFNVLYSSWGEFAAGENTVEAPSSELVRLAGSAHAAGAIEVTEGLELSHVESQEDSEAKLAEAMGEWIPPAHQPDGTFAAGYWSGPWGEGHRAQADADAAARAAGEGTDVAIESGEEA